MKWISLGLGVPLLSACAALYSADASLPTVRIDAAAILGHIEVLASDRFEGRMPGTAGAELTVAYLQDTFKRYGLAPGNPDGTYLQEVTLAGVTSTMDVSINVGGARVALQPKVDYSGGSWQPRPSVSVRASDLVFVGHGIVAPEYGWDDYKQMDMHGKTVVLLMSDLGFRPDRKTYYATGDYKRRFAAQRGAAACITVHEIDRAGGTPFSAYASQFGAENLVLAQNADSECPAEMVITIERARDLFNRAGLDFDRLHDGARSKDFIPVVLDATADIDIRSTLRTIRTHNVVARVEGSDPRLKDDVVVYTAHWDHLGRVPNGAPDQIYHGALDNASGTAAILEIAHAFATATQRPRRSVLFIATTAEEAGLLGAKHYVTHPLFPLARTVADLNFDLVNAWGRTEDFQITGFGESSLDDVLRNVAAEQGRRVIPDQTPELMTYYRVDSFEFARSGIPSVYFGAGIDYIGKPPQYRKEKLGAYFANDYHRVTDTVRADWDLSGAAEQALFGFGVGWRLTEGRPFPQWRPGTEFKATRDAMLK